jgi:hypothetical protein
MAARIRVVALLVALVVSLAPPTARAAQPDLVTETTSRVVGSVVRRLPFAVDHVALYWAGHRNARVRVDLGDGRLVDAGRDDLGAQRHDGRTYGAMLVTTPTRKLRIVSSEPITKLTVLGIGSGHPIQRVLDKLVPGAPQVGPGEDRAPRPPIVSRAEWGADESLRYSNGKESWPPAFAPTTKLIVHHTDTANNDPNPAATVRAIYRYHAISQGWGDIGYNFLIDATGRIYKGRNSHAPGSDADTITGQNAQGEGVTGAHARGYNSGSVGVSLLGTLTNQDATPAAKRALEDLLAWEADLHHIDPHGSTSDPNIAGHRDVGDTQCPGGAFYATLPQVRDAVATRM